ncbi:MAG: hypothetical protein AB7K24_05595 [Gemmataceae bacterium]
MLRRLSILLLGVLLITPALAQDAAAPAGNWKLAFFSEGRLQPLWIVSFEQKDGKWTGKTLDTSEGVAPGEVSKVAVKDGQLSFTFTLKSPRGSRELTFEGKLPKEKGKKILGSVALGRQSIIGELAPTEAKSFNDRLVLTKERVENAIGPELFEASLELLSQAEKEKATPEQVRSWANKVVSAAEAYGPRWQLNIAGNVAEILSEQKGFEGVAVEYAQRARRLMDDDTEPMTQVRVLNLLSEVLTKAGKADDAKTITAEADKIYLKNMPPYKVEKFAGRKNKKGQTVLLELFTGAECPPCVAADLAFDGIEKSYDPGEVVLLQYHLHIPRPDPLTNEDTEARMSYYEDEIGGTPTVLFNGRLKPKTGGGGGFDDAKEKYSIYREAIDPILETESPVTVKAKAVRKGDKIDITAEASGIDKPNEKLRLRLALVEDKVRFTGGNTLRFHHQVVRALPGGAKGFPIKDKSIKEEITVDLAHVKETLTKYLDKYNKEKQPFPRTDRPLDLKDLKVVAFVQNDENKDVLAAVQVPVEAAE